VDAARQGRGKKLAAAAARYALHVTTGDALQGGAAGRVTVTLHGARTKGAALALTSERAASTHETPFARGQTDTFRVDQQVRLRRALRGGFMREGGGRVRLRIGMWMRLIGPVSWLERLFCAIRHECNVVPASFSSNGGSGLGVEA